MTKRGISPPSRTDWGRVDALRDRDIDLTDLPEVAPGDFARCLVRKGPRQLQAKPTFASPPGLAAAQDHARLAGDSEGERRHAMRFFSFEIVIEKEPEDPGYYAYSPTLPGCFSNGLTIEETKVNIREAVRQHLEVLLAQGQEIPQHERLVHVEELTVGVPG